MNKTSNEHGLINPLIVITIVLSVFTVGLGSFSVWAYINYQDYKNNVDSKISAATAEAKTQQSEQDEKDFVEREKQPTRLLVGPSDLGRVSFSYPKNWSVYVDQNGSKGSYEAYLHPGTVPPIEGKTPYALRISVVDSSYQEELARYQRDIEAGDLKAKSVTVQGEAGTRLEGVLAKDVQGIMILFKVRDKTLKVFTESRTFQHDFDTIVLKSLEFNR